MRTDELDFDLPPELIAQEPAPDRSASRLLHYRRADRSIRHATFREIASLLRPDDLLVLNDTKVLPARFELRKPTGGRIDGLFLEEKSPGRWIVLLKNLGPYRGALFFASLPTVEVAVLESRSNGEFEIEVKCVQPAAQFLDCIGRMPLPPYIKRDTQSPARDELDRQRYQTVFAKLPGSVAAPTAGLHFTPELLAGLQTAFVTLHVGLGTFKPVVASTLEEHQMHSESYEITPESAEILNQAKATGRRIVAVGTTSARVLESQLENEPFRPHHGQTSIFVYPPYHWRHVQALITNFHLPRSTLIALVAAFVGLGEQRRIYAEAIAQRYRFFSYGDAMFLE
jgi:S-adenosylmethionine:tRNA ribosyltransferase-isomerase